MPILTHGQRAHFPHFMDRLAVACVSIVSRPAAATRRWAIVSTRGRRGGVSTRRRRRDAIDATPRSRTLQATPVVERARRARHRQDLVPQLFFGPM